MTTVAPPTSGLAGLLREGSAAAHRSAEDSTFMRDLLDGRIDGLGYARYLVCLRRVYEALEDLGTRLAEDDSVAAVLDQRLFRVPALDADIAFWTSVDTPGATSPATPGEGSSPTVSPATDRYVSRILATLKDPKLYIAHHYTRYLGDLSGGQAIGRILTRHHGLTGSEGVQFYAFADIPKPKPYKDAYRARLDALPLSTAEKQAVVDEARLAFQLNSDLFAELSLQGMTVTSR